MNNIEKYPKCHMRTSLGNCDPMGGFCTSVNTDICEALHKVADRPTGEWVEQESDNIEKIYLCSNCENYEAWGETEKTPYCPNCGARMFKGGEKK